MLSDIYEMLELLRFLKVWSLRDIYIIQYY